MLPADAAEPYDVAGDPRLAEALVTPLEEAKIRGIARSVRKAIFNGDYEPGGQLPTRTEMARANGVSPETIGNVMRMLAGEGLVRLEQGRGSYVEAVRRYRVDVLVPMAQTADEKARAEATALVDAQRDDDPAIEEATVEWKVQRAVVMLKLAAADSGRAAARGLAVARYACPPQAEGWDFAGASVTARPA